MTAGANVKEEHGRQAVTSEERHWISVARTELGDLSILPEVLRHWHKTGEKLEPIAINEAVQIFTQAAEKDYPNRRTFNDIRERLDKFSEHFRTRYVHEISVFEIEAFLGKFSAGWHRWSIHKRLKPFFKFAKRRRWVPLIRWRKFRRQKLRRQNKGRHGLMSQSYSKMLRRV